MEQNEKRVEQTVKTHFTIGIVKYGNYFCRTSNGQKAA